MGGRLKRGTSVGKGSGRDAVAPLPSMGDWGWGIGVGNASGGWGVVYPRPPAVEGKAKPCPYPFAERTERQLGCDAVPTLPARGTALTRGRGKGVR